jgi:uncharacterized membrane protein
MSTLTVWKFQSAEGAEKSEAALKSLERAGPVEIPDAAVVTWPGGRGRGRSS